MPHFNTQLRLLNKDYAIKGLVVCLQCSMARIFDLWDGSLDQRKVRGFLVVAKMAIKLKFRYNS